MLSSYSLEEIVSQNSVPESSTCDVTLLLESFQPLMPWLLRLRLLCLLWRASSSLSVSLCLLSRWNASLTRAAIVIAPRVKAKVVREGLRKEGLRRIRL